MQFQTPPPHSLCIWLKAAFDHGDVESGSIERAQPVCAIEQPHKILWVVAGWLENKVSLDPCIWVVYGRARSVVDAHVWAKGLQIKG